MKKKKDTDWQIIRRSYFVNVYDDGDIEVTPVPFTSCKSYRDLHTMEVEQFGLPSLATYLNDISGPTVPFTAEKLEEMFANVPDYEPLKVRPIT